MTVIDNEPEVWVFLVERGLDAGSNPSLFWRGADAIDAARDHLAGSWPVQRLETHDQVYEAIDQAVG